MNADFITPLDAFTIIDLILMLMLLIVGLAIVRLNDIFAIVMLAGVYSLVSALWFVSLDAVDVAFTEAAVGAGISTVLMLGAMLLSSRTALPAKPVRKWASFFIVLATGAALMYAVTDMPSFGDPLSAPNAYVGLEYLKRSLPDTEIPNVVSSVLASYRGYDTLGETSVILTAGLGVMLILGMGGKINGQLKKKAIDYDNADAQAHHTVLRVVSKMMIPLIVLYGFYVQFHGDFGPGGGFQAGVIIASAVILYALIFGVDAAKAAVPPLVVRIGAALGVLIYGGTGIAGLILGSNYLDYNVLDPHSAPHGQELGIMSIEIGVLITVCSVMLVIFYGFTSRQPDITDKDW